MNTIAITISFYAIKSHFHFISKVTQENKKKNKNTYRMKFESCLRLADTLNSGCLITTHNRVSTPHHLLYVSTKRNIPEFLENTLVTKIICTEFLWST